MAEGDAKTTTGRRKRTAAKTPAKGRKPAPKRKSPATKAKAEPAAETTQPPETAAPAEVAPRDDIRDTILGQVARLMMQSPRHRHLFVADLEWLAMPPMALGQARIILDKDRRPMGFGCWALVSEEVEKRLETGNPRLSPSEWRSGDRLWLIDVITPEALLPSVLETLAREVFKGRKVRSLIRVPEAPPPVTPAPEPL